MTIPVRVAITDDVAMHRSAIKMALSLLGRQTGNFDFQIVAEYENGQQLMDNVQSVDPDLITLDIRMPKRDGLSSLFLLRKKMNWTKPIIMASSENEKNLELQRQKPVSDKIANMSESEKLSFMKKIEQRLLTGTEEEGKINDLLGGCQTLILDPRAYALHLGANGFLHKPYKAEEVAATVPEVVNGKTFDFVR